MHAQIFRRAFLIAIVGAAIASAFSVSVFGQKEITEGCADYNCWISRANQLIQSHPKDAEAYRIRGYAYMTLGLYPEAIKDFNRLKELDAANSYADECLKYIYATIKRSEFSFEQYDKLILLEPTNADFYYYRSRLHFRAKNFKNAIEDTSKAIELNPKYTDAYGIRSDSYCKIGKWKESTADIKKYEQLTEKSSGAVCFIDLAKNLSYCADSDDDCRLDIYEAGIANSAFIKFPFNIGDLYAGRGYIYYKRGELERAYSDFENAEKHSYYLKIKPIELYFAKQLLIKDKYDEALRRFKLAVPEAEAYLGIGQVNLIKRNFDTALENFDKALFLNPRFSQAYLGRGTIYLERGRIYEDFENNREKAVESYKKAVKDFDSVTEVDLKDINPEVYLRRAKVYERLGELEKAEADRKKYLESSEKP